MLTFGGVLGKRASGGKPLRMLIARRKPTSKSSYSFLAKVLSMIEHRRDVLHKR
jgi:hypothetical protein